MVEPGVAFRDWGWNWLKPFPTVMVCVAAAVVVVDAGEDPDVDDVDKVVVVVEVEDESTVDRKAVDDDVPAYVPTVTYVDTYVVVAGPATSGGPTSTEEVDPSNVVAESVNVANVDDDDDDETAPTEDDEVEMNESAAAHVSASMESMEHKMARVSLSSEGDIAVSNMVTPVSVTPFSAKARELSRR